ncbi:hypothetical protein L6164_014690 [Bauhinia variegata]|uniref:Uncharacterized protein n=1 Tax=Bauhinia variegata TaxID=167791 RepID=A0ACB9NJJ6_BAUVA|nr:hypothetical protein L6164_014690 [Bauhinia variegata]
MNKFDFRKYTASSSSFDLRKKFPWWYEILDPGSEFVGRWYRTFLVACLAALFLDPLYFYYPVNDGDACIRNDIILGIAVTFSRTVTDLFFLFHIVIKFRTAYISRRSRVFGRGVPVKDPHKIARRYLKSDFILDVLCALPLPQIVTWFVIPATKGSRKTAAHTNHTLSLIVLVQYIPRFFQIFPLQRRIIKNSGIITQNAWAGAVYNLGFYMLASHILGAAWYLLSIQRQYECWRITCRNEMNSTRSPSCNPTFLDCSTTTNPERAFWLRRSKVLTECDPTNNKAGFQFGMFADAFADNVASSKFIQKYFYCLWWGLKNLSSYGQNITTSTFFGETLFCSFICLAGLVLFAHLIGNMQNYLQSSTVRLEEWRVKQRDTEEWMRHRQLPPDLQQRVRQFLRYKWLATKGVDEESILRSLPLDLRRQIQRHLCLALVRRVPFFGQMDDQLLDAICERLVSSLNTKDTYYSHQWRTWGACYIQAAWRRYHKRKMALELLEKESLYYTNLTEDRDMNAEDDETTAGESSKGDSSSHVQVQHLGATVLASRFAKNTRRGAGEKLALPDSNSLKMPKLFKPSDPDFLADHDD